MSAAKRAPQAAGEPRDAYAPLRALITDAGYTVVEPPIVYAASVFVEVAGEDLRRRLFLTSADGNELALRPDYTIPVCLHHLATGAAKRRADYAYLGPVFRQRGDEPGEFLQAGIESIGRTDSLAADADVLQLAFAAAKELGVNRPVVRIGDSGLFAALLAALDLSEPWRRRLARAFGDPKRLRALIAEASGGGESDANDDELSALAGADRIAVEAVVAELFASTGLGVIGGRTAEEIADRFVEKAALAEGISGHQAGVLSEFLTIAGPPPQAIDEIEALARRAELDLNRATDRFRKRTDAFAKRGIAIDDLGFSTDFGRRVDYYTGFVFEFHRGKRSTVGPVIGGGRYDRLMSLIPHPKDDTRVGTVPAVGFAIWLDRVGGKR